MEHSYLFKMTGTMLTPCITYQIIGFWVPSGLHWYDAVYFCCLNVAVPFAEWPKPETACHS